MYVLDSYKLYFRWNGLHYDRGVTSFIKAWFYGPVLLGASKIQDNDFLDLDYTKQNLNTGLFVPKDFYIARLSWKTVTYIEDIVLLEECKLSHNKAGSLSNLKEGSSFLIDCSNHDETRHAKHLVYPAAVLNTELEVLGSN
jgi:hypothetical protein